MAYLSLYRKWRPQTFDEIVGQSHITQTLKNAVEKGRISHAYLFCGPRGTGKTTTARALAKAINCVHGPTPAPCNECASCTSINDGSSMDVLELDAASNRKVDQIRDLLEKIPYSSTEGRKKVYIIDEVHMLTDESFNTLLKTLEEPPEHVIFVLATTESHKVLPTILSRCQRFDFRRISAPDIEARLRFVADAEGIAIEPSALSLTAHRANGALRDALGILEQLSSFAREGVTSADVVSLLGLTDAALLFDFTDMLIKGDLAAGLVFIDELVENGVDLRQFIQDLLGRLRALFLIQSVPNAVPSGVPDELMERLLQQAAAVNSQSLVFFIHTLSDVYNQSRWATDMRLLFEIALFKIVKADSDTSTEGILHRLERLETALLTGAPPHSEAAPSRAVSKAAPQAPPERAGTAGTAVPVPEGAEGGGKKERAATGQKKRAPATKRIETGSQAPPGRPLDIETVRALWPQVLKIIKDKKPSRYSFFAAGAPSRIDDSRLVVVFKKGAKDFVGTPENLQLLQGALKVMSGSDTPIVLELEAGAIKTVGVAEDAAAQLDPLPPDDYIKLVQDTFGAKIVEEISIDEIKNRGDI